MTQPETEIETENVRPQRPWMIFWLALLIATAPMMVPYLTGLWNQERYRYFPFVILAVAYLVYQRWNRDWMPPRGWPCVAAVFGGLGCSVLGAMIHSPWVSAVGFLAVVTSFLVSHEGDHDWTLAALAMPLGLLLHLPLGYDQLLVMRLQTITTSLSSVMLDTLHVPHAAANNTIQLASRELFVAEACSGIQSVFTLIFMAMLLVAIYRRPLWLSPLYIAIAIVLAVFANVVRVTTVALGDAWMGIDLASGWQHEVVGYAALGMASLFLLSFDHLVISVLHPVDHSGGQNPLIDLWNHFFDGDRRSSVIIDWLEHGGGPLSRLVRSVWTRRTILPIAGIVGITGIAQAVQMELLRDWFVEERPIVLQADKSLMDIPLNSLAIVDHDQSRGGDNPRLGANADIWNCSIDNRNDAQAQVVLSQPFSGWHELCNCYVASQWLVLNRGVEDGAEEDPVEPYAIARLKKGENQFAYLLYSAVAPDGKVIRPPPRPGRLGARFEDNFFDAFADSSVQASNLLMLQMFVPMTGSLDRDLLKGLKEDFVSMRQAVRQSLIEQADSPDALVASTEEVSP